MFCTKCGKPVTEGRKFCGACGAPVLVPDNAKTAPATRITPPPAAPAAPATRITPPPAAPAAPATRITPPPAAPAAPATRITPPPAAPAAPATRITPPPAAPAAPATRITPPPAAPAAPATRITPPPAAPAAPAKPAKKTKKQPIVPAPPVVSAPSEVSAEQNTNYEYYSADNGQLQFPTAEKLSKSEYVSNLASGSVKAASITGRLVGLLCIALTVLLGAVALISPINNMPVFDFAGVDIDSVVDTVDQLSAEVSPFAEVVTQDFGDAVQKAADNPSIINLYLLSSTGMEEAAPFSVDTSVIDEVSGAFLVLIAVFIFGVLLVATLAVFGLIFRNNILTSIAMLFACAFAVLFNGWLYLAAVALLFVAQIMLQLLVNSNYADYLRQ